MLWWLLEAQVQVLLHTPLKLVIIILIRTRFHTGLVTILMHLVALLINTVTGARFRNSWISGATLKVWDGLRIIPKPLACASTASIPTLAPLTLRANITMSDVDTLPTVTVLALLPE